MRKPSIKLIMTPIAIVKQILKLLHSDKRYQFLFQISQSPIFASLGKYLDLRDY